MLRSGDENGFLSACFEATNAGACGQGRRSVLRRGRAPAPEPEPELTAAPGARTSPSSRAARPRPVPSGPLGCRGGVWVGPPRAGFCGAHVRGRGEGRGARAGSVGPRPRDRGAPDLSASPDRWRGRRRVRGDAQPPRRGRASTSLSGPAPRVSTALRRRAYAASGGRTDAQGPGRRLLLGAAPSRLGPLRRRPGPPASPFVGLRAQPPPPPTLHQPLSPSSALPSFPLRPSPLRPSPPAVPSLPSPRLPSPPPWPSPPPSRRAPPHPPPPTRGEAEALRRTPRTPGGAPQRCPGGGPAPLGPAFCYSAGAARASVAGAAPRAAGSAVPSSSSSASVRAPRSRPRGGPQRGEPRAASAPSRQASLAPREDLSPGTPPLAPGTRRRRRGPHAPTGPTTGGARGSWRWVGGVARRRGLRTARGERRGRGTRPLWGPARPALRRPQGGESAPSKTSYFSPTWFQGGGEISGCFGAKGEVGEVTDKIPFLFLV